jgi:polyisoprenoid-binding protein YceI
MRTVRGCFESFSGAIIVAEDGTPSVTAEVAISSIQTQNSLRNAGLRRLDPFDTNAFPVATFVSTAVTAISDGYALDGDLTLRGVTRPICLDLTFRGARTTAAGDDVAMFSAKVVLNRRDFGVEIGLPVTGGVLIGLDVAVDIQVRAIKGS